MLSHFPPPGEPAKMEYGMNLMTYRKFAMEQKGKIMNKELDVYQ